MSLLRRPPQLTYANVISSLALFAALGGSAYAASGGFVSSGGAVRFCVTKAGSVSAVKSGKKCKHGTTTLVLNQQGVPGKVGNTGNTGPQGPPGPATGAAGGALSGSYPNPSLGSEVVGTSNLANGSVTSAKLAKEAVHAANLGTITEVTNSVAIANTATGTIRAACPTGTVLISGGFQPANFGVNATSSLREGNEWEYQAVNNSGAGSTLVVFAYCLAA